MKNLIKFILNLSAITAVSVASVPSAFSQNQFLNGTEVNIDKIAGNEKVKKYDFIVYLGGGAGIPIDYKTVNTGYIIQAGFIYPISRHTGIKTDLSYHHHTRSRSTFFNTTEGNISAFAVKVGFAAGNLKPESETIVFGIVGIGLGSINEGPGESFAMFALELGAGFGYKLSPRIGIYTEAAYNPLIGIFRSGHHLSITAGVMFTFF